MKKHIKPIFTGIIITSVMIMIMLKITMDFQILLFFGAFMFFAGGLFNARSTSHYLLTTTLVAFIYLSLYIFIVLKEIPELWYFVPIFFVATLSGAMFRSHRKVAMVLFLGLTLIMIGVSIKLIPRDIENSLTQERYDTLPNFTLQDISGNEINSESLKGKTVVLDFFGTWCKPCILELSQLNKVKTAFKENDDVVFYVIDADIGGDTPKKFNTFIEKNDYEFTFVYDHDSDLYKLLELQQFGLPVLLIIDKDQNIRKQHVGYNPAETHFANNMINYIKNIQ